MAISSTIIYVVTFYSFDSEIFLPLQIVYFPGLNSKDDIEGYSIKKDVILPLLPIFSSFLATLQ